MKKTLSKMIAVCLSMLLVFGAIPYTVLAAGGTTGEVSWSLNGDTLTISGNGEMANYSASSSPDWEDYSDSIKKIVVGSGVTKIGNYSFFGLDKATSVTLNEGLKTIGTYAFNFCSELTQLEIPSTVKNIGNAAFGNSGITDITFKGASLEAVGTNTFKTISNAKIIVPSGFTIGSTAAVAAKTGNAPFYNNYVGFSNGKGTVYWINDDGTVLETDTDVTAGATPTYDGATPEKANSTFKGWTPDVAAAAANKIAIYTAAYDEALPSIEVNWFHNEPSAGWDYVENADHYNAELFKNGVSTGDVVTLENEGYAQSNDFSDEIIASGSGAYSVKVKAFDNNDAVIAQGETGVNNFYILSVVINAENGGYAYVEDSYGGFGVFSTNTYVRNSAEYTLSADSETGYVLTGVTVNGAAVSLPYVLTLNADTTVEITYEQDTTRIPITVNFGTGHANEAQAFVDALNENDADCNATLNGSVITLETLQ